ncbi:hypothetical protein [Streptomyces sp. NBC_01462]|uniref:hypothetical protein n=1 Tax=Streptomyces sp. NBC_01462 TaxID=2903876 RepID=UPI002E35241D|nr:hypothetical protein [Streptomyces sp. NBC_01462]
MRQDPWFAERLRFWLLILGATVAFGLAGLLLSALKAPSTFTWAAAAGAAVAGGWGANQVMQRYSKR